MIEIPFAQAVATKAGIELETVEQVLLAAGVPTTDEAASPHRLRVNRVRFEGTKTGKQTDAFCFDQSFSAGLWAICTEKNDAGKTSVLEIIMWALRGHPHKPGLPPDVEGWLERVLVEGALDDEPFTVDFRLTNGVPFGSLTYANERFPFSNEDSFTNTMADFMLSRLGFFEFTTWDGTKGAVARHGWAACSAALYLPREFQGVVLGDIAAGGVAQRLVLMFVGVRWGQTHVACQTARNQEEDRLQHAKATGVRIRAATAETIAVRRRELEEVRRQLDELPPGLPDEAQIDQAHRAWLQAIAEHGEAHRELAQASNDARSSRNKATVEQKSLQDRKEAALALALFHGLRPTTCPRCNVSIGTDRQEAEAERHTCAVCDREVDLAGTSADGSPVEADDADEPMDEAGFAELVADLVQAAAEDQAHVVVVERRVALIDERRQAADALVARYREQAAAVSLRRTLEVRLGTGQAVIDELDKLGGEAVGPTPDGSDQRLLILKTAADEAKSRVEEGFAAVFTAVNDAILDLANKFGFENLQAAKLDAAARLTVKKGDISMPFSKCSPGEKLRLRIAVVIALLRVANEQNLGRHPGFLLIDSIGTEETEPGDLAAFVRELAAVTEELGIETVIASARPEILTHVPGNHQIVATGDEYLW